MEHNYNQWTGTQHNPTLYANPSSLPDPYSSLLQATHYPTLHSLPPNPNPYSEPQYTTPGSGLDYAYQYTIDASSGQATSLYYPDPNLVQNLEANEAFRLSQELAISVNGTKTLASANINPNFCIQPLRSGPWKKGQKKVKIVQSVWCDVCKIACNSKTVLDQHKLGKKHKNTLEKSKGGNAIATSTSSAPLVASEISVKPFVGPQENPGKVKSANEQNTGKKAAEPMENLETKRRKVLEGGAATDEVRICHLCNVVCNSETVFKIHLIGKKHIASMKKQAFGAGIAPAI